MKTVAHTYQNVSFATAAGLRDLLQDGATLQVRNDEVRELRNRLTILASPMERCLFLPHRRHNVFACLAETVWVLAGRNDVAWLAPYLPRAAVFSDNGVTWRAAYGPRFRNWQGIDQFKAVRDLITAERATRRAVMNLFDPASDYVASKDIPCNNWLHWLVRDNRLHLNIGVRSNDIIWGFSGVNSFEWSTLQQMLAHWCGVAVGEATYLASSFHLYRRHYDRARECVAAFRGITCYDFGLTAPTFTTPLDDFDAVLQEWMRIEAEFRVNPNSPIRVRDAIADPWLAAALELCRLHLGAASGWSEAALAEGLQQLPESDLTAAAYEYFARTFPALPENSPHPQVAAFLLAFATGTKPRRPADLSALRQRIKALHAQKDAGYGNSWKRRGEKTSILANIARKVDRIAQFETNGAAIDGESILDTAFDLFVYVTKYRLFLLQELPNESRQALPATAAQPLSDHRENFDLLVDQTIPHPSAANLVPRLETEFETLHHLAERNAGFGDRYAQATHLAELSLAYVQETASQVGHSS